MATVLIEVDSYNSMYLIYTAKDFSIAGVAKMSSGSLREVSAVAIHARFPNAAGESIETCRISFRDLL
jgi:hypothetical protein